MNPQESQAFTTCALPDGQPLMRLPTVRLDHLRGSALPGLTTDNAEHWQSFSTLLEERYGPPQPLSPQGRHGYWLSTPDSLVTLQVAVNHPDSQSALAGHTGFAVGVTELLGELAADGEPQAIERIEAAIGRVLLHLASLTGGGDSMGRASMTVC